MIVIEMRGDQECALAIPGQAARLVHKIERDQESNVAISALETEDVILAAYRDVGAYRQSRFLAPQRDQPLEEPQERTPVVFQRLDVALFNVSTLRFSTSGPIGSHGSASLKPPFLPASQRIGVRSGSRFSS